MQDLTLALAMFLGRFLVIVPVLAIAGSLAAKPITPSSAGTLPTTGVIFVALLTGVIVIVGGPLSCLRSRLAPWPSISP